MVASISIMELNGAAPGVGTDKTSGTVRFKNADNATVDLNNPLVVPTSDTEYSFTKMLRLLDNGDQYTQISNIRGYSDGAGFEHGSPETAKVWAVASPSYSAPYVPDQTADPPHFSSDGSGGSPQTLMVDLFTYTSGAPIDLDGFNAGPFTPGSPTEYIGDILVLLAEIEVGALQGLLTAETLTIAWDEI